MSALQGLDARLRLARLVLRTDARRRQGDLAVFLAAALAGGVDVVEVDPGGLDPTAGAAVLETVRSAAATSQAVVGVAGSSTWAAAVRADLLTLRADGEPTADARARLHPFALVGRSVHDAGQLAAALGDDGLDHVVVGPVSAAGGLDLVRRAARDAPVFSMAARPWFAAGGIHAGNLDAVLAAGARRVLVARAVTEADDPEEAAARLAAPLAQAWRADPGAERYVFAALASPGRSR